MNARELFQAGKLTEAVQALAGEVRDNPTDPKRRTFLFELLCFAGDYDRAEKHLHVLSQAGPSSEMGALLYRGVMHGERARQEMFARREWAGMAVSEPPPFTGSLNGKPFESLADADDRIGARIETFAAGSYLWIPFAHIASLTMQPPKRLRDLLWIPAVLRTGPAFKGQELGEVLIPVLSPLSSQYPDDNVRLGRATVWEEEEDGRAIPYGQKMLLVDGEEIPLLDVRELIIEVRPTAAAAEA
jgi:type VI secretion system protein ImpE